MLTELWLVHVDDPYLTQNYLPFWYCVKGKHFYFFRIDAFSFSSLALMFCYIFNDLASFSNKLLLAHFHALLHVV